jgi:hypothetical protein
VVPYTAPTISAKICVNCRTPFVLGPKEHRGNRRYCAGCRSEAQAQGLAICVHGHHTGPRMQPLTDFYRTSRGAPMSYCKGCHQLPVPPKPHEVVA